MVTDGATVTNLSTMAEELAATGRHSRLVGSIRNAVSVHSLITDLQIARDSCERLQRMVAEAAGGEAMPDPIIGTALLMQCVILYCRATKTTSRVRKTFQIQSALTPDQKIVHKELCDLRDDAFAHFGGGGSCKLLLYQESAVMHENGNLGFIGRRLVADGGLVNRLALQLDVAAEILKKHEMESSQNLAVQLSEALSIPEVAASVINHHVSLRSTGLSDSTIYAMKAARENGPNVMGIETVPIKVFGTVVTKGQPLMKPSGSNR